MTRPLGRGNKLKKETGFSQNCRMSQRKRILFIAPHRLDRAPSQRFRFEQYLSYLSENGFECTVSSLVSKEDDLVFYSKNMLFFKFFLFLKFFFRRIKDVLRASKFDVVYIQREMFFIGPPFFEYLLKLRDTKVVFDYDDSIWLPNVSEANKNLNWLKSYSKTSKIIAYADLIFAGNKYLSDYASQFNKNVKIIPTTIDTKEYVRIESDRETSSICIGWSGSITTIQHFRFAEPFLKIIKEKYDDRVHFKAIGDKNYSNPYFDVTALDWNKADELRELSSFDIGIMPLPDDMWAKGKCGLKGLQYMALEIPTIMSPVGVNEEIIQDGVNGFLATDVNEWVEKISLLIESEELRREMGKNARQTVVDKYSFEALKNVYLDVFKKMSDNKSTL